jgi:hypothetical protein
VIFKAGVITEGVRPPTWYAIGVFEGLFYKWGERLVVTSLTDGVHPDLKHIHKNGFAADLRIRGISSDTIAHIVGEAKAILFPLGYDTVLEKDHIHVEWDPAPHRGSWSIAEQVPVGVKV